MEVSSRIREDLLTRAGEFNIKLEDVSITHLTFGKEFTQAVEAKQIAQQGIGPLGLRYASTLTNLFRRRTRQVHRRESQSFGASLHKQNLTTIHRLSKNAKRLSSELKAKRRLPLPSRGLSTKLVTHSLRSVKSKPAKPLPSPYSPILM